VNSSVDLKRLVKTRGGKKGKAHRTPECSDHLAVTHQIRRKGRGERRAQKQLLVGKKRIALRCNRHKTRLSSLRGKKEERLDEHVTRSTLEREEKEKALFRSQRGG